MHRFGVEISQYNWERCARVWSSPKWSSFLGTSGSSLGTEPDLYWIVRKHLAFPIIQASVNWHCLVDHLNSARTLEKRCMLCRLQAWRGGTTLTVSCAFGGLVPCPVTALLTIFRKFQSKENFQ